MREGALAQHSRPLQSALQVARHPQDDVGIALSGSAHLAKAIDKSVIERDPENAATERRAVPPPVRQITGPAIGLAGRL